jgi:chromosome segregation protein
MYVKALRLAGFKSFSNPTILEFERGTNVIVGPNGSGKSNISDALSWALGSQAPSTLRGGSMEDVIFAGSESRPRLAVAEVELTLDNSSRLLPIDVAEITISRFTDRSGASEYRINGAACRLLDLMELLSDTGVGRSIHTVVGQGQLDAVLQARPEERRGFIEEAAQIGKYRRRKERSLRKIERVEHNVARLNDVLAELRRALRPLRRQASAAASYSEIMAEHRDLKQRLAATELHRLKEEESALGLVAQEQRAGLLADEIAHVRARLDGAERDRDVRMVEAEQQRHLADRMARAIERLRAVGRLAQERAAGIEARLESETEEGYRERIKLLEAEVIRWGEQAHSQQGLAHAAAEEATALQGRAAAAHRALEQAENRLARARALETSAAQDLVRAEGSEAAGRTTVGSLEARVRAALERRDVRTRELAADTAALQGAEEEVRTIEEQLDRVTEAAARAEAKLEHERDKAEELRERLAVARAHRSGARARVEALEEVAVLLADVPLVAERLGPLLEGAGRDDARAATGERDAADLVEEAEARSEQAWLVVADQDEKLRRLDALMAGAAERVAGRRRQLETREIELAALDDELARARDALAAAERAATEERAALPERRATFEECQRARAEAERVMHAARAAVRKAGEEANAAAMEARSAGERLLAARLRGEEAEAGIADAHKALTGLAHRRSMLQGARARALGVARAAAAAVFSAKAWSDEAETRALAARARARAADAELASLRARERELEDRLQHAAARRNQAQIRRAEMRARGAAIAERAMDEWGLSVDDLTAIEPVEAGAEAAGQKRADALERDLRRLGPVNPRAAEECSELAERESFMLEQMDDLRASKRDLMKIVRDVDGTIVEVFGRAFEDVAREFEVVFQRLFPGGSGKLKLTTPDDVLNSGIDIEARPPGKNVKKLSLLSGGERSLVALAFLFAIFRSRPSPFYLLDEVEAALDDVNLLRFLGLIEELEERAQVLIVTHQRRTMEAADVLYGVTMKDGVSYVVAKRMEDVQV